MNATERYKILQNIIAKQGIEVDLYSELAKAESMINAIDQGRIMPPSLPPEVNQPIETPITQSPQEIIPENETPM